MNDLVNGGDAVNSAVKSGRAGSGIDGNGTEDQKNFDKSCLNCKVNLADFIDKCKIPCKNCRDPAWKCPQDVGGK